MGSGAAAICRQLQQQQQWASGSSSLSRLVLRPALNSPFLAAGSFHPQQQQHCGCGWVPRTGCSSSRSVTAKSRTCCCSAAAAAAAVTAASAQEEPVSSKRACQQQQQQHTGYTLMCCHVGTPTATATEAAKSCLVQYQDPHQNVIPLRPVPLSRPLLLQQQQQREGHGRAQVPHQRCRFMAVKAAAAALIVPRPTIRPAAAAAAGVVAQQQLRSPLQHYCRRPCWSA